MAANYRCILSWTHSVDTGQAPVPSRPTDRDLAGPGLAAHVLVSKSADHQPLYRESEIYAPCLDRTESSLVPMNRARP